MTALPPRPVRYALAWAGAAGVAVAIGLLAVSLLGGGARPTLAAGATAPSASSSAAPTSAAPGAMVGRPTDGGVVYGTCAGPGATPAVSGVPAAGWEIGASGSTVQFERDDREIRVTVGCDAAGAVTFGVELDDRGGSGSSGPGSSAPAPSSVTSSSGGDDHGGATASATSGGGSGSGSGSSSGGSGSGSGVSGSGGSGSGSGGSGSGGSGSGGSGGGSGDGGGHGSDD